MQAPSLPDTAQRTKDDLASVNTRIARLALILGVSLEEESNIQAVLNKEHGALSAHFPHRAQASHHQNARTRHLARALEELRGLLVLRYAMVKHAIQEEGLAVTLQIAVGATIATERKGFKPGMDGFDIVDAFGAPPVLQDEGNPPMGG